MAKYLRILLVVAVLGWLALSSQSSVEAARYRAGAPRVEAARYRAGAPRLEAARYRAGAARAAAQQRRREAPKGPMPRLADGKPDLSGVWNGGGPIEDITVGLPKGETIPILPEAQK